MQEKGEEKSPESSRAIDGKGNGGDRKSSVK
jgi:hypothetical protein